MAEIKGTNVSAPIVPFDDRDLDNYGTHNANYGIGGYQSVSNYTELENFPESRRVPGMRLRVLNDPDTAKNVEWELINGAWQKPKYVVDSENYANAANTAKILAEAALDASINTKNVYPSTSAALSNGVLAITISSSGSGGANGSFPLIFSGGGGNNAAGFFQVSNGSVSTVVLTASGYNYSSSPSISFSSAGVAGASANAIIGLNVSNGSYFTTPSSNANTSYVLYQNQNNVAVKIKEYPSQEYVKSFEYDVAYTFYVSKANNASDSNSGTRLKYPKKTIKGAFNAINEIQNREGDVSCVVIVHPGDYIVEPDTVIPRNCGLYGYDLRVTTLRLPPGKESNNMFQMSSGIKARGFTFKNIRQEKITKDLVSKVNNVSGGIIAANSKSGFYFVSNTDNKLYVTNRDISGTLVANEVTHDIPPSQGFAFVFRPGEYITRSPYLADCSQLHEFTYDEMTLPMDRVNGNPVMNENKVIGGGNLLADGSVLNNNSPLKSVVVDSFTAINPNGYAYLVTKSAFVQLVSVFTNWSRYGIWAHDGGNITITNSNITFGDYSLASTNYRYSIRVPNTEIISVNKSAAEYLYDFDGPANDFYGPEKNITANANTIIMNMWNTIENSNTFPITNKTVGTPEAPTEYDLYKKYTLRDADTLLTSIAYDLRSGQTRATKFFILGLFNWNGECYIRDSYLENVYESYDSIQSQINAIGAFDAAKEDVAKLLGMVKYVLQNANNTDLGIYERIKIPYPSKIETTSHQFSYAGSGVNYNALPPEQRGTGIAPDPRTTLIKENGGKIYATFATESGDTYLGEDIRVDFERSTIEGQAFSRGVQNITLPLVIGVGG